MEVTGGALDRKTSRRDAGEREIGEREERGRREAESQVQMKATGGGRRRGWTL